LRVRVLVLSSMSPWRDAPCVTVRRVENVTSNMSKPCKSSRVKAAVQRCVGGFIHPLCASMRPRVPPGCADGSYVFWVSLEVLRAAHNGPGDDPRTEAPPKHATIDEPYPVGVEIVDIWFVVT